MNRNIYLLEQCTRDTEGNIGPWLAIIPFTSKPIAEDYMKTQGKFTRTYTPNGERFDLVSKPVSFRIRAMRLM